MVLNLDANRSARVSLPGLAGDSWVFVVTADKLSDRAVKLNGAPLTAGKDGTLPTLVGEQHGAHGVAHLDLPPYAHAFVVFPDAGAEACK